jgi:hypothetical protein
VEFDNFLDYFGYRVSPINQKWSVSEDIDAASCFFFLISSFFYSIKPIICRLIRMLDEARRIQWRPGRAPFSTKLFWFRLRNA